MPPGFGVMMGHEASTLASEYGPQWINMPNFAFRYQAVRSSEKIEANAVGVSSGSEPAKAAILMKSRLLLWNLAWFGLQLSELSTVLLWDRRICSFQS